MQYGVTTHKTAGCNFCIVLLHNFINSKSYMCWIIILMTAAVAKSFQ